MRVSRLKRIDHVYGSILVALLRPLSLVLGKALKRKHDLQVANQLVVLKMLGGGSLLLALPALLGLRERFPKVRFSLVCTSQVKPFAELMGIFDEIIIIELSTTVKLIRTSLLAIKRCFVADCFINLEIHSKLAGCFSLLSAARNRFGLYLSWNRWQFGFTTHWIFYNESSSIAVAYNQIAETLGATVPNMAQVSERFRNSICADISHSTDNKFVALAPFCSELCREREFSAEEWITVLSDRQKFPENTVFRIYGGGVDAVRAELMSLLLNSKLPQMKFVNRAGKLPLMEAVKEIALASEMITIDSGLNHVARLLRLKVTSYWGPSDPSRRLLPFPDQLLNETVHYRRINCSPCVHAIDPAPCCGNNICMKQFVTEIDSKTLNKGWVLRRGEHCV